jgi:hypothetical protein
MAVPRSFVRIARASYVRQQGDSADITGHRACPFSAKSQSRQDASIVSAKKKKAVGMAAGGLRTLNRIGAYFTTAFNSPLV